MSDHCENSQTQPCPNKPYRLMVISIGEMPLYSITLCRKHHCALQKVLAK